ncbi:hypothetical protein OG824_31910 [Streptomyces prunicolor]|uniref:hypothetical protein n=1 Tax=Streptomyces prunicolor TaxID=67348 RepID=UPI002254A4F6|nr:hypothetical protein [Streptomyces prunicolor]MCX5239817.1 hypothetical protein [Streptomyces prunicolor]
MAEPKPKLNRQQRRTRQRQVIKQVLDGPPRTPVCGQAKAAARARARAANRQEPQMPKKGGTQEKALVRERRAATGKPYGACLAEVRAEWAAQRGDQTVQAEP